MSKDRELVLFVGTAAITKAITSIGNRGAKLDNDIQLAGLSVLAHIEAHGDVTLADSLYKAMPRGSRRNALANWLLAHGKLIELDKKDDAEAIKAGRVFGYSKEKTTDMEGAESIQWTEFKHSDGELSDVAFDVQKAVDTLLKRIASAKKAGRKLEGLKAAKDMAAALATYQE